MNNTKMMKTSAVIDRILNFFQILIIICGIAVIILAILMLVSGDRILSHANLSLTLGALNLSLDETSQVVDIPALKLSLIFKLIAAAVMFAFVWYGIRLIRQLLRSMKEGRPFDNNASKTIQHLAWVVLTGGIVNAVIRMIAMGIEIRAIYFSTLFHSAAITGYNIDYTLDIGFIVTALILFLLSYIFRYGEELQRESDETL